jgi:YrbI family 3-deoxy-D-manno-octulosonate 8-phosphate phosphatase
LSELEPLLSGVRLAVFDFDGVFTDNCVWVNERGEESVRCCRADGFGLARLREVGVEAVILTTEAVPIAAARAQKLEVACRHGLVDKLAALREEAERCGVPLEETAYVGNDINDAACLEAVGLPVVPADAWPEVAGLARWTLERRGGEGCVREFCDAVWAARQL